jgi:7-carboxy-7-deazaguanine synthase
MERYVPSTEEIANYSRRRELLSVSGDGVFATLQGEGVTAGEPAVFLRLQDCNLHCGRDDIGWQCDAWYTWDKSTPEFWKERANRQTSDIVQDVLEAWQEAHGDKEISPRLVITGGEPLLQQAKLIPLLESLSDWSVEIETNGTITPDERLASCQFNCSPKLASSGNALRARYRPTALRAIAEMPNSWFKFVVATPDDEAEIVRIISENDIPAEKVLLMAEGVDADTLTARREKVKEIACNIGGTAIERNHIFWFGDKRRT